MIGYIFVINFINVYSFILSNIVLIGRFYLFFAISVSCRDLKQKGIKDVIFTEFLCYLAWAHQYLILYVWELGIWHVISKIRIEITRVGCFIR